MLIQHRFGLEIVARYITGYVIIILNISEYEDDNLSLYQYHNNFVLWGLLQSPSLYLLI